MRTLPSILITGALLGGLASADSGVRIHRLSDPPLPPRGVEMKTTSRGASIFRRGARPAPVRRSTPLAVGTTAPQQVTTPPPPPAVVRPTVIPIAPKGAQPAKVVPPQQAVPVAPAPAKVVAPPATPAPIPAMAPVAGKRLVSPAPAPIARPATNQPDMPRSNRPRRRLPIAPM